MIRILHVINWFVRAGAERLLLGILRDYDRSRFHMDVCCIGSEEGYLADEARSYGAKILMCRRSINMFSLSRRFGRLLEAGNYDIVHSHFDTWSGPLLRAASRVGIPVRLAHLHSTIPVGRGAQGGLAARLGIPLLVWWGRRWVSRYATHVYGVSRAVLDANWPGWRRDPHRFGVWTGGVDTGVFSPRRSEDARRDGRGRAIVFVGSLLPTKNHEMLLAVFSRAVRIVDGVTLDLVGEGPERRTIERSMAEKGLKHRVRLLGARDDVSDILRPAAVFVSCSKIEGLSIAILEAQASGVPVVASDIPAHREALCPELWPFLFRLDDPQAACDATVRLLKDEKLRAKLGEAGRRFVVRHFDATKALDRLQDMYQASFAEAGNRAHEG